MDEGSVCRVHQADNSVVDRTVQEGRNLNHAIGRRRQRKRRDVGNCLIRLLRIGDEHPHIAVSFATGVGRHADLLGLDWRALYQSGNALAAAFVVESPAMIGALHAIVAHVSERQRHAAMRANIPHGRDISG